VKTLNINNAVDVGAGGGHACYVNKRGAARCVGEGVQGQLGAGEFENANLLVQVVGLESGVERVIGMYGSSCALKKSGGVTCWGTDNYGEQGTGRGGPTNIPVSNILRPSALTITPRRW
jgi:alpha-tubulin suppressor-like RCC1 family protein